MLFKHYKYGRIVDVIHTAVVEDGVSAVFGWRPQEAGFTFGVVADQDATHKHGTSARVFGVAVRVFGIPGKITTCKARHILGS